MEKHVYFVRHGESDSNVDRILRGPHSKLTEAGREQAKVVAERIARVNVDVIISSPLKRARDTADVIAAKTRVPIEESDLFAEYERPSITLGKSEHDSEVAELRKLVYEGHLVQNFRHSDEENFEDIKTRGLAALHLLAAYPKERICVVSHGFFMRALLGLILLGDGFTGREFQRMYHHVRTNNVGLTYAKYSENIWKLITWNDQSHLG